MCFCAMASRVGLGFLLCFGEGWGLFVLVLFSGLFFEGVRGDGLSFKGSEALCTLFCSKGDNFSRLDDLRLVYFVSKQMDSFKINLK